MSKYKHFELDEFIKSDVATQRKIDNTPTFEVVEHLEELVENFLEPLRIALGYPIVINSGYRCAKLNRAVGGSDTSAHPLGFAADISCPYMSFSKFRDFVVNWATKTKPRFDQILLESEKTTGKQWIHVGIYNRSRQQRGQIKVMNV